MYAAMSTPTKGATVRPRLTRSLMTVELAFVSVSIGRNANGSEYHFQLIFR